MATLEPPEVQLRPRLAPRASQMEVPRQCVCVCENLLQGATASPPGWRTRPSSWGGKGSRSAHVRAESMVDPDPWAPAGAGRGGGGLRTLPAKVGAVGVNDSRGLTAFGCQSGPLPTHPPAPWKTQEATDPTLEGSQTHLPTLLATSSALWALDAGWSLRCPGEPPASCPGLRRGPHGCRRQSDGRPGSHTHLMSDSNLIRRERRWECSESVKNFILYFSFHTE